MGGDGGDDASVDSGGDDGATGGDIVRGGAEWCGDHDTVACDGWSWVVVDGDVDFDDPVWGACGDDAFVECDHGIGCRVVCADVCDA